jgi:acyl-CoA synthetase (AMP-forming)/AMP-acid ligase II
MGVAQVIPGFLPGGKFQLKTQDVRGAPVRTFKNLPATLRDVYEPLFEKSKDKVWVVYEDERYTYGEVRSIYEAVGRELVHGLGIQKGDKVGIAMRNFPEFLVSFIAIQNCGAVAVPLNSLWKTEELEVG